MARAGSRACPPLPPVIGHRGAAASAPENTLAGLRRAHRLGCRWVEFDVRLSADGALVLCHDARVDRTGNRKGRVARMTLVELQKVDAGGCFGPDFVGEAIPTLDEALSLCAQLDLGANIEIKADRGRARATAAAVSEVVERFLRRLAERASLDPCAARAAQDKDFPESVTEALYPGQRFETASQRTHGIGCRRPAILVSSFHRDSLEEFRSRRPDIPTGLLLKSVSRRWRAWAQELECTTVNVAHATLQPHLVDAMRAAGYPVLAYTVNDPARAATLFNWGVTSVFSDVPDIILAMVRSNRGSSLHLQAEAALPPRHRSVG